MKKIVDIINCEKSEKKHMNVWIDICHTPQYNFFKPLIYQLVERGHKVYITVLDRGKTPKIIQHELAELPVEIDVIGRHRMTKWSVIVEANLIRLVRIIGWRMRHHVDVGLSNGFHAAVACWLTRTPNYTFGDDPDTFDYYPKWLCSSGEHFTIYEKPEGLKLAKSTKVLRCLKEWAYLNPRTFKPDVKALETYGVKPKEYMFLREVTVGTINYAGQENGAILGIKDMIPKGMKVLFSLEEKKRRNEYPENWILLQEPIEDIHSLIYYSAGLVSSGDSMAREAALLGVPSYYLGIRYSMPANAAASKVASLQNRKTQPFEEWVKGLEVRGERLEAEQKALREHIDKEFIDINQYMLNLIEKNKKNNAMMNGGI